VIKEYDSKLEILRVFALEKSFSLERVERRLCKWSLPNHCLGFSSASAIASRKFYGLMSHGYQPYDWRQKLRGPHSSISSYAYYPIPQLEQCPPGTVYAHAPHPQNRETGATITNTCV